MRVFNYLEDLYTNNVLSLSNRTSDRSRLVINGDNKGRSDAYKILSNIDFIEQHLDIDAETAFKLYKEFKDPEELDRWVESVVKRNKKNALDRKIDNIEKGSFSLSALTPLVDLSTGTHFLWDIDSNNISSVHFEAYKALLGPKILAELRNSGGFGHAKFIYDPYNLERKSEGEMDGKAVDVVNTYNPPEWRFNKRDGIFHSEIKDFLKHLFPNKKDLSVVLSFLKESILHRVAHIMVLEGKRAVGKNVFVEHIVAPLVGTKYFAKAPKGFFESRFQDILINNRLIFFDELEAKSEKQMNDIKRLANHTQGVERKGMDLAQYNAYYSCIANTNDPLAFPVQYDERRIFFPEITNTRLEDYMNKREIKSFIKFLSDPDVISEFGHYVIDRTTDEEFDVENAYINAKFKEIVSLNLSPTKRFIVDKVTNHNTNSIEIQDLRDMYFDEGNSGHFLSETKIKLFIDDYLHEGKKLGDFVKIEGRGRINIAEHLLNDITETKGDILD